MTDPTRPGQSSAQAGGLSAITGVSILGGLLVAAAIGFVTLRDPAPDDAVDDGAAPTPPGITATPGPSAIPPAPESAIPESRVPPDAAGVDVAIETPPGGSIPDLPAETGAIGSADGPADPLADPIASDLRFDLVRVDPGGGAVIAGFAAPGASVTLTLDGVPVETVSADAAGQFAAILSLPPSDAPRILGLQAALPDGIDLTSAQTVIIAPFAGDALASVSPPVPPPVTRIDRPGVGEVTGTPPVLGGTAEPQPVTDAGTDLAAATPEGAPAPETSLPDTAPPAGPEPRLAEPQVAEPQVAQLPEPTSAPPGMTASPPPAPEAPAVLLADGDGIRVLQGPGGAPEVTTDLRLDAITYDVAGEVTLAGRAPAEGSVRATLDNRPISLGEVGPGGQWSLDLPDVDPGTYTLRLEQIAADGRVTGLVETPFLREDPDRIRLNPMLVDPGASVITVQRGFTLWGIAEANFGAGIRYVQIFEQNRDQIRDPDLIFPGQIFALPDLPRATP